MKHIRNRCLRSCSMVLTAVLLVVVLVLPCFAAEDQTVLRVAYPQSDGFTMTTPDGRRYGLVVDFLNEIAKYTGWKYEYVDMDSDTFLDEFLAGQADLLGGTYYADGYEQYFGYPDFNCGYSRLILLARSDDPSIKSYDLDSLNGKTIGVYDRNFENIRRLQEYLKINNLECTLKYYSFDDLSESKNLVQYLERGEIDLLLSNSTEIGKNLYIAASFESQPHYIVTAPDNQEIFNSLNFALEQIYDADPNFAKNLYETYFPTGANGYAALTAEEREYIAQKKTVTVAVPHNWHPLYCINNGDNHDGLIPDILKEITDYSGLEFSYLLCDSYADALELVLQGEADLLGFFAGTNDDAIERGLALSAPYVELDAILVRNKKTSYPADHLVGALLKGRDVPSHLVAEEILYYSDTTAALSDVNRGRVDFYYGISSHLEYIIQQENFTNIVQVNLINDNLSIGFAMTSPVQPELLTILNKAIHNLTSEQKATINGRNIISIGETHMTLSSIVYANPGLAIAVVATFLSLILIVVILVARSRLHAAAMRAHLEEAEADSRAKSAFLSRMSHEIRTPMNAIVVLTDLTYAMDGLPERAMENLMKIKSSSRYLLNLISDILDMSRIELDRIAMTSDPFSMQTLLTEMTQMMQAYSSGKHVTLYIEQEIQDDHLLGDSTRLRQVLINLLSNAFKFTSEGGAIVVRATQVDSSDSNATLKFQVIDNGIGISQEDQKRIFDRFEQVGPNITKSQGTGLGLAISHYLVQLMGGELRVKSDLGVGSEFYFTITLPKAQPCEPHVPAQSVTDDPILQGVNILVVEDNDLNAEILVELLQQQGAVVHRAENGKAALDQFTQSLPGAFQVILMDILMPEMNGLEATQAIRSLPRADAAQIPILAMTANAFREDEKAAMAAGMNCFLSKPIDVSCLYQELRNVLQT